MVFNLNIIISNSGGLSSLLTLTVISAFIYQFIYKYWSYFTDRNIKYVRGIPLFGTNYKMIFGQEAPGPAVQRLYKTFPTEQIIGMYDMGGFPLYVVRDPNLIKQIGIQDFNCFMNHSFDIGEKTDPLMAKNLFFIKNQPWKDMRSTLSPAFTGSKMRLMFSLMTDCSENFVKYLGIEMKTIDMNDGVYEMKELFSRFANDTIATCAFGLKVNSLKDKNNDFFLTGKSMSKNSTSVLLKLFGFGAFPKLMNSLKIRIINERDEDFFRDVLRKTLEHRRSNKIVRNDMISLLTQAADGKICLNDLDNKNENVGFATSDEYIVRSNKKVKGKIHLHW